MINYSADSIPFSFGGGESTHSAQSSAYADLKVADAYHGARQSSTVWNGFDDEQKLQRLTSASDFIDRVAPLGYIGQPESVAQIRAFPRVLPDASVAVTPYQVVAACCELALLNDISGSLPNSADLKSIGSVLLKGEDCDCDNKEMLLAVQMAVLMLGQFFKRKSVHCVRLGRG